MKSNNSILIVEDDPGIRDAYKEILCPSDKLDVINKGASLFDDQKQEGKMTQRQHYKLTFAERGEESIEMAKKAVETKKPFAVAFVDMKMPGIDGAETSKRIWTVDPDIKIIIVTAFSDYTPESIVQVTGRDDIFYLRKPFNPEEIRQFARALTKEWNLEREKGLLSSELEKSNKELAGINLNLKEKVEEQTVLLVQSEKMASIGVLASGIAHEINNPISFIHANLSSFKTYNSRIKDLLIQYEELENYIDKGLNQRIVSKLDEIREYKKNQKIDFILEDMVTLAEESFEGTNRVRDIVRDLKTFSHIDESEFKSIDLNELLDTTLNIIWSEVKYKADVVKDYEKLPEVKCFPKKISQAFMNLMMNAAQSIEGKGAITITSRFIKKGQRTEDEKVKITISDTGKGIPKDELLKIFDPFFTTKPVGEGTGLGLNITYEIIRAHGGEITFKSEVGSGTNVTIILPLKAKI